MQVTVNGLPGRPKGTLEQLVQGDMKKMGLKEEQAMDQKSWKKMIAGPTIAGKKMDSRENDDNDVDFYGYIALYAYIGVIQQ